MACRGETGRRKGDRDGDIRVDAGGNTPPMKSLFEVNGNGSRGREVDGADNGEGKGVMAFGKDIVFLPD